MIKILLLCLLSFNLYASSVLWFVGPPTPPLEPAQAQVVPQHYSIKQRIELKLYDTCDVKLDYYALRVQNDTYNQDERSRYLLKVWKKRCKVN